MNPPVVVLRPGDAPRLSKLHAQGFEHPWCCTQMRTLLATPAMLALGIETQDTAGLRAAIMVQIAADEADILTLVTAREARRQGFAHTLIAAASSRLGERGVARILLDVAVDNAPARAFYLAEGFGEDGVRKAYYASGADALLLSRPVTMRSGHSRA